MKWKNEYVSLADIESLKPEFREMIFDHIKENKGKFSLAETCKIFWDLFGQKMLKELPEPPKGF
jgi:hypothetical protein